MQTEGAALNFVDVWAKSETPAAPAGMRYLDFLGGTKQLRCYLVPKELPRSDFFQQYGHLLHPALSPVYQEIGFTIRQDSSYPVPGFYILGFDKHYRSFDIMPLSLHLRSFLLIHILRRLMRDQLGIEYIHLYYEEKPDKSCNVHYWLLPVWDSELKKTEVIMHLNLGEYLSKFNWQKNEAKILRYNDVIRNALQRPENVVCDEELSRDLSIASPCTSKSR